MDPLNESDDTFSKVNNSLQIVVAVLALIGFVIATINSILIVLRMFTPNFFKIKLSYFKNNVAQEFMDIFKNATDLEMFKLDFHENLSDLNILQKFKENLEVLYHKVSEENQHKTRENISSIRKTKFDCRYDPSRFTILSLFPYTFNFISVICKEGPKYAYYFDYTFGKPKLMPVKKDDSLFTAVTETISRKVIVVERIDEEDERVYEGLKEILLDRDSKLEINYLIFRMALAFNFLYNSSFKKHVDSDVVKILKAFYILLTPSFFGILNEKLIKRSIELQFLIDILKEGNKMLARNSKVYPA